jgi:hypothetical protein
MDDIQEQPKLRVFISYSHDDEFMLIELNKHLAPLRRTGSIETWHDRALTAGEYLDERIFEELNTSDIILTLMSASFIASDFCYSREMARALERHESGEARIIPIILRRCDWDDTPLGKIVALPEDAKPVKSWDDQDEAWYSVVSGIKRAIPDVARLRQRRVREASSPAEAEQSGEPLTDEDDLLDISLEVGDLGILDYGVALEQSAESITERVGRIGALFEEVAIDLTEATTQIEDPKTDSFRKRNAIVMSLTAKLNQFADQVDAETSEISSAWVQVENAMLKILSLIPASSQGEQAEIHTLVDQVKVEFEPVREVVPVVEELRDVLSQLQTAGIGRSFNASLQRVLRSSAGLVRMLKQGIAVGGSIESRIQELLNPETSNTLA